MAKAKNPNRVKAGKKAWAKMKREGKGIAGASKKKKSGGTRGSSKSLSGGGSVSKHPKRLSASAIVLVGGIIALYTAMGQRKAGVFVAQMQVFVQRLGFVNTVVSGASIVALIVGFKLLGSVSPWFGRKWRGFLSGFGLRP